MFRSRWLVPLVAAVVIALRGSAAQAQMTFNFTLASFGLPPEVTYDQALSSLSAAAAQWSRQFTDSITVDIFVDFDAPDSPETLAETLPTTLPYLYAEEFLPALAADATSADDLSAVAHLPADQIRMLINATYLPDNPNGDRSLIPYLDQNNSANNLFVLISRANAKALELPVDFSFDPFDAYMTFNNAPDLFDFDPGNGIDLDRFDFAGTAAHEIGHALGFISAVDWLDSEGFLLENEFSLFSPVSTLVSSLDLYRFSEASVLQGNGVIDMTRGGFPGSDQLGRYFSLDGGATPIAPFATGEFYGDGDQASHWKRNLNIGIMDASTAPGELRRFTENDLRMFDAMGLNRAVPEPSSLLLLAIGGLGPVAALLAHRRRSR